MRGMVDRGRGVVDTIHSRGVNDMGEQYNIDFEESTLCTSSSWDVEIEGTQACMHAWSGGGLNIPSIG
jgi:hypothetical protein